MHKFLRQNGRILIFYIFRRRINTSWSKGFNKFWSGGIGTYCAEKIMQEKLTKFPMIFELYQVFIGNFLPQIIYCRRVLKAFSLLPTILYYLPTLSVKISSFPLFSTSGKQQLHHLAGYQATGINSLLSSF